ncbi:MAG: hypothetical protein H5T76_34670 [Streptomyces sp.]|nr:hypothetical protein [Streptomyces sp.]
MNAAEAVAGPVSGQTSLTHRLRGLVGAGFVATLAAMVATSLAAALAQAVGVGFEIPDGGGTIPLVPPLLSGADTATTTALLGLRLVPATVMIPTLPTERR